MSSFSHNSGFSIPMGILVASLLICYYLNQEIWNIYGQNYVQNSGWGFVLSVLLYHLWKHLNFCRFCICLFHGHTKLIAYHHPLNDSSHRVFPLFFFLSHWDTILVLLLIFISMTLLLYNITFYIELIKVSHL